MNNNKPRSFRSRKIENRSFRRLLDLVAGRDALGLYVTTVLCVMIAGSASAIRNDGIFACQDLSGDHDSYIAYCQATQFGDYDHGAFWFGLERDAFKAASEARVLFIGNSRMQFGLSSGALHDWFASRSISYYLLGFSHFENQTFFRPLLRKLQPEADVYVINIDRFFDSRVTQPADAAMNDPESLNRALQKRRWQGVHRTLCGAASLLCRNEVAFFRSRSTGAWRRQGGNFPPQSPVTYDNSVDRELLEAYRVSGAQFISDMLPPDACIILTNTPKANDSVGTAEQLARALDLPLIAPQVPGLSTFDGSHLDRESANRWSAAFVLELQPLVRDCLDGAGS